MSQQVLDQISNSRNYKCEKNRQFEVRSAQFFAYPKLNRTPCSYAFYCLLTSR